MPKKPTKTKSNNTQLARFTSANLDRAEAVTDSEIVAENAGTERRAVNQLIKKHRDQIEKFGLLTFEMHKVPIGRPIKYHKPTQPTRRK